MLANSEELIFDDYMLSGSKMDDANEIKDDLMLQTDELFDELKAYDEIFAMENDDKKHDAKNDAGKLEEDTKRLITNLLSTT